MTVHVLLEGNLFGAAWHGFAWLSAATGGINDASDSAHRDNAANGINGAIGQIVSVQLSSIHLPT